MAKIVVLALFLLSLWKLSVAQAPPQCSTLNVDNALSSPAAGSNLGVCTTQDQQCCTQAYIDDVTQRAQEFLQNGLREELAMRIDGYNDIVQRVSQYFTQDFTNQFLAGLPLSSFITGQVRTQLLNLLQTFRTNIQIMRGGSTFDVTDFLTNVTQRLEQLAAGALDGGNMTRETCIINFIRQRVNQTVVDLVVNTLEQIRRGVSSASRIRDFLQNFNRTLANFQPLRQCSERLVELSFCSRCTHNIPPLCSNTCGALVRACYSPFLAGLRGEFDNLWNVTRQVIRVTNNTLMQLFALEGQVFEFNLFSLIGDLRSSCGDISIPGFPGRKRRQSARQLIPPEVMNRLNQLRGVFEFDEDGPEICEPDSNRLTCSGGNNDANRRCGARAICTAACNCWDGNMNRTTNTQRFTDSTIEGQVDNPVIQLDQDMLMSQARSLGTPVSSFLVGENFTEVEPNGVTMPPAEPYGGGAGSTEVEPNGVTTPPADPYGGGTRSTVVSLAVILLTAVLAISL